MSTAIRRRAIVASVALLGAAALWLAFASSHSTIATGAALKPAQTGAGENLTNGKRGGTLTVYDSEDFLHLDPGESYFDLDYTVMYATQMPLYEYLPNTASKLSPMLASKKVWPMKSKTPAWI